MVGPAVKRDAVAHLRTSMGLSERRACRIVGADWATVRYRSRRPADAELCVRLRELANERRRFSYWRLFIWLRREGEPSGINRISIDDHFRPSIAPSDFTRRQISDSER